MRPKKYLKNDWTKGKPTFFYWDCLGNTRADLNNLKQLDAFLSNYWLLCGPEFSFLHLFFICNRKTQSTIWMWIQKLGTLLYVYICIYKKISLLLKCHICFLICVCFLTHKHTYSHFKAAEKRLIPSRRYTSQRREHYRRWYT